MSERNHRSDAWGDDEDEAALPPVKALTRDQAQALRATIRPVSPWRVVGVQAAVGVVVALLAGGWTASATVAWSALYGAVCVVLPAALMARGMTSPLSSASPGIGAMSFMAWEMAKIGMSIALLMLAGRIVQPLSWPALLVGLVVCIKVYWVALAWRGR